MNGLPATPISPTERDQDMTDHPTPSSATSDTASEDLVTQACVHIDAAVRQVEAAADADVFSPLLGLAGLLSLIRGGLDPSIRAVDDPNDPLLPMDHVDRALSLLDGVPPSAGPVDLLVWSLRLHDLHDALLAAVIGQR
jgi:hypothetical protein